jgi:uncharacterized protein (DUF2235 family)
MYRALADHYDEGRSDVYLFGFSRGAFTVRVLAGLLYRCGLLPPKRRNFDALFFRAYSLYKPHQPKVECVEKFRRENTVRECKVRFLGLWDTVKSYGGIVPRTLPHLRHNPIVKTVCHALALDEHRSWFIPTSWGGIDSDKANAGSIPHDDGYAVQQVKEVWFRGCHSDVGGGDAEAETAKIALRWMLNEAVACGLVLNGDGRDGRAEAMHLEPEAPPVIHESFNRRWCISEYLPRWELDNHFRPPKRYFKCGRSGERNPLLFKRHGKILLHSSVGTEYGVQSQYVATPREA